MIRDSRYETSGSEGLPIVAHSRYPMKGRNRITSADLFVLLDREFRRRSPRECAACFVPLPYRIDAREQASANWELVPPSSCRQGCDLLIEELVAEFQEKYDLIDERRDEA